ncbi:GTPase-activating protein, partial [Nowakowskiella sp. JEL0078]
MKFPARKTTAIVGLSGSGKSTIGSSIHKIYIRWINKFLVNLLERFHSPTSGSILIDSQPIESYNLLSLRKQISVVMQDSYLFEESILKNIARGFVNSDEKNGAIKESVRELCIQAAKNVNAHEFICKLPDGYDTIVNKGAGVNFSGGQRQRIALARAIVRNPKILILDEATSSLDSENERLVQIGIDQISQSITTIIIAHRFSTICSATNIIVMSEGKILEQ